MLRLKLRAELLKKIRERDLIDRELDRIAEEKEKMANLEVIRGKTVKKFQKSSGKMEEEYTQTKALNQKVLLQDKDDEDREGNKILNPDVRKKYE